MLGSPPMWVEGGSVPVPAPVVMLLLLLVPARTCTHKQAYNFSPPLTGPTCTSICDCPAVTCCSCTGLRILAPPSRGQLVHSICDCPAVTCCSCMLLLLQRIWMPILATSGAKASNLLFPTRPHLNFGVGGCCLTLGHCASVRIPTAAGQNLANENDNNLPKFLPTRFSI